MMKNVIRFKRDISLRQGMFTSESFAHPAKLDAQLLIWLVEKFTAPGETILDPMFGSGTLMLACALGRNVIGVELEQKFVDMAKKNWEKVRQRPQLGHEMGTCQILQGDARNLSGLLADKVITSPPYSNSPIGGGLATKPPREGHNDTVRSPNSPSQLGAGKYDKIFTSPPYIAQTSTSKQTAHLFEGRQLFKNGRDPQPHSKGQIGDLCYGDIDSIMDLHNGQIDDIIKSNGQMLQGMREAIDTEGTGERTSVSLSQKAILQSKLPSQPSQSVDQNQTERTSTSNNECRNTPPMADRKLYERQIGAESSSRTSGRESVTGSQDVEASRNVSEVKRKRGRISPKLAGRMEEISGSELADTTEESTREGQLPVSDMPRANRASSSLDTLSDKQGQQPDQSIEFMRSVSWQSNRSDSQSNPQDSSQALQTPLVDSVITSPPYEASVSTQNSNPEARIKRLRIAGYKKIPSIHSDLSKDWKYGVTNNIGNLKGESYLQSMSQVYQQCHAVLRPGGLMILIVKSFIRKQKIIDLAADTMKLCEHAGFTFQERWYRELPAQSFWRILYRRKYPDAPELKFEDVLVFEKQREIEERYAHIAAERCSQSVMRLDM